MNWFRDYLPDEQLVIDASFLINVFASGATTEIFSALLQPCLVEENVIREIRRHPIPTLCHAEELQSLERSNYICKTRMTDEEYFQYLSIIQAPLGLRLDSGESATLVVGHGRGLAVVIDENKARTFIRQKMPAVSVTSTLKLFISVAFRLNQDVEFLRSIVKHSLLHGRMGVPKDEKILLKSILDLPTQNGNLEHAFLGPE